MTDPNICPVCKNPKKSKSSGSLTQWIADCTCDLAAPPQLDQDGQEISIKLCKDCGKRVNEGRSGSLTQFIFRSDVCQCKKPNAPEDLFTTATAVSAVTQELEEVVESELESEIEGFPYERYKPLEHLGHDTGGSVYLARDRLLNKKVAVKMLLNLERRQLIAFHDEARATSKLDHPTIVKLLDFGISDSGIPYMVLEYVNGQSLEAVLERDGPLPWRTCQVLFQDILEGLAYAHENGIYHRDLKPSNIIILDSSSERDKFSIKIIDFGIAKVTNQDQSSTTEQSKTVVGAPFYMSPDQGLGRPYDNRSEVYSLGCVLFECLTGKPPFIGETALQTLSMHANVKPPSLTSSIDSVIPQDIEAIVKKALAKNPDDRFQSAHQFRSHLLEIQDKQSTQTIGVQGKLPAQTEGGKKKGKVATALLCLLAACALSITSYLYFKNGQDPKTNSKEDALKKEMAATKSKYRFKSMVVGTETDSILTDLQIDAPAHWEISPRGFLATGHNITDEDFKKLKDFPNVKSIKVVAPSKVTGEGLKYLAADMKAIALASQIFDNKGAKQILRFKKLTQLKIHNSKKLTNKSISYLLSPPNLKMIEFRYIKNLPLHTIAEIIKKTTLTYVDLGHSAPIKKKQFANIPSMPMLTYLRVSNSEVDDSYIDIINKTHLKNLDINDSKVTDIGLLKLVELNTLKAMRLSVRAGKISKFGVDQFKKLRPDVDLKILGNFGLEASEYGEEDLIDSIMTDAQKKLKRIKKSQEQNKF